MQAVVFDSLVWLVSFIFHPSINNANVVLQLAVSDPQRSRSSVAMADPTDLNLDAPSDLQDIPEMSMQLLPPPEGTFPDK